MALLDRDLILPILQMKKPRSRDAELSCFTKYRVGQGFGPRGMIQEPMLFGTLASWPSRAPIQCSPGILSLTHGLVASNGCATQLLKRYKIQIQDQWQLDSFDFTHDPFPLPRRKHAVPCAHSARDGGGWHMVLVATALWKVEFP